MSEKFKKDPLVFLEHILESIRNVEIFSKNLSKGNFIKSRLKQSAIIRELEIIGEAVANLSNDFRDKYPNVMWKKIVGFRDKMIHNYFGVNLERVWNVIEYELPKLKKDVQEVLEKEEE